MAQIHGLLDNLVRRQGLGQIPPQGKPSTASKLDGDMLAPTTTTQHSGFLAATTTSTATTTVTAVEPAFGVPPVPPAFGVPPVPPTNTPPVEQPAATNTSKSNEGNFPVGAVVGGVVGGIALIAFLFTMLLFWRRRRQRATTARDGGGVSSRGIGAESMEGKQPFMRASSGSGGTSDDGERGLDEFKQHPPMQYQQQQQQHPHPHPQRFHSESTMVDAASPPLGPLIQSQSSLPNFGPSRPLSQTYSPSSSSPSPSPIPPMHNQGAFGGQMPPASAGYSPGQAQAGTSPPGPRPLYQQHSGSVPNPANYVPRSSYIQTKALSFPNAGVSAGAVGTGAGLGVAEAGAAAMAVTAGGAGVALERRNSLAPSLSEATEAGGFFELIPVDETPRIPHAELLASSSNPVPGTTARSGKSRIEEDQEEEEEEDRLLKDVDWSEIRRTRPTSSMTGLSSGVLASPIALAGAYDDDDGEDDGEIDEGELQYL
ncbi:hypothetical protein BGW38_007806 [Lunasporangiospora selenospora]|uniref:Uncharacterized protein n=1 Tax=Lunasporangiospora selenospora TaxID=979761 RepID=A0A9P6K9H1_9FUNG|nr:hypothetical protein BGW38_007806 [Lunasporangiospora selenospora]